MQLPRNIRIGLYSVATIAAISAVILPAYFQLHGWDYATYDTGQRTVNYTGESKTETFVLKIHRNRRLSGSRLLYYEMFVDEDSDADVEQYIDSRGTTRNKFVVYKSPDSRKTASVGRNEFAFFRMPGVSLTVIHEDGRVVYLGQTTPDRRGKTSEIDTDSIREGMVMLGMTEEEEEFFNKMYLDALKRADEKKKR